MCMEQDESICLLFYECKYSKLLWNGLREELHMKMHWEARGIEENLKLQFEKSGYKTVRCIPFLIFWAIQIVRNEMIFDNRFIPSFVINGKVVALLGLF